MSKARLVITAVTVEKRPVSEVARAYGVARSRVYALLARYQAEGEAAFKPGSRRPKTSPTAISDDAADLIIRLRKDVAGQGLDAGPQTIASHLQHHHQVKVSAATVSRYLARSTPTATTSPPAAHQAGQRKHRDPHAGSRCPLCLATSHVWQVLGSNQRRLSRRFYSTLLPPEPHPADQCIRHSRRVCGLPPSAMRPCVPGFGVRWVHGRARTSPRTGAEKATDGAGGSGYADRRTLFLALTCQVKRYAPLS
jgi:transposase